MKKNSIVFAIILCIFLTLIGCSDDWKAKIESDTSWKASVTSGISNIVIGSGNRTIDMPNDDIVCCVATKQTANGFLRVTLINEGGSIFSSGKGPSKETSASYGGVSVCNK